MKNQVAFKITILLSQVADLSLQMEESETGGGRGVKAQIRKLEQRIMELESDLDTEARKSADVLKQARKADKRVKECEFALEVGLEVMDVSINEWSRCFYHSSH